MSFNKIKQLFDELSTLSPAARTERLAGADISEQTRSALRRLLDLDNAMAGDLEQVLPGRQGLISEQIGPFMIDGLMAEGGMGQVYRAHRMVSGVRQTLAIKVIRRDRLDTVTRARFQVERQVLAVLKHPHIASMVDVGETSDGRPYLAMEFVEGEHITRYADVRQLDLRARVRLFRDVASAIAYAHRNLIVHRDLKPSNVLVDVNGIVKVIDFGIAKPLMTRIGESEVSATQTAHRFFSPYSAAPEQLLGGLITASCDIYGLGALLYELLTDQPVFDLTGKTALEIEKTILSQEPILPSVRLRLQSGTGISSDKDLDAIALCCLRKLPEDRYSSVERLIADVDAWLECRPVLARRGNVWYRLRRFGKRHRRALAFTASILMILFLAGATILGALQTTTSSFKRAELHTRLLIKALQAANPGDGNPQDLRIRDAFRQISQTINEDRTVDEDERTELQLTIARVFQETGDARSAEDIIAHLPVSASEEPDQRERHFLLRGVIARDLGDYDGAEVFLTKAAEQATGQRLLEIKFEHARVARLKGSNERAETLLKEIEGSALTTGMEIRRLLLKADLLASRSESAAASIPLCDAAIAKIENGGTNWASMRLLAYETRLNAFMLLKQLDYAAAALTQVEGLVRKFYGPDTLANARAIASAARLAQLRGDAEHATNLQRESLAVLERNSLGSTVILAQHYHTLGQYELARGDRGAAHRAAATAAALADELGPNHEAVRHEFRLSQALLLAEEGRFGDSKRSIEVLVGASPWSNSALGKETRLLAQFLIEAGTLDSPSSAAAFPGLASGFNRLAAQATDDSVRQALVQIRPALVARGLSVDVVDGRKGDGH